MHILLLAKSKNTSISRIQDKYKRLKLVIKFDLPKSFNELKTLYELPENSVELSEEETTEQFNRKQIVLQSVEQKYIPVWEITPDIEEAIKRLNQDKQQIIQNQVRNAIRHKMENSENLTPQSLLELYNKQEHENKKIEKRKNLIRQTEIDLEAREQEDRLRDGDINRRERQLEEKEKRNSAALAQQVQADAEINQTIIEHAEAVQEWEESKRQAEEKLRADREELEREKEKFEREKEEKIQTKLLNMISPSKNRKEAEKIQQEKVALERERLAFEEYRKKLEKEMKNLQAGESQIQKTHNETLKRLQENPNLLNAEEEINETEIIDNSALGDISLWEDMQGMNLHDKNDAPPKGNLNKTNADNNDDLLAVIAEQANKNPFPPARIGPTQMRNGPPPNLSATHNYVFNTGEEENDVRATKIEIPKIPTDVSELETYIDVLESLAELFPHPRTFIYSILIKSGQMGLLPMLQPKEKESLSEFAAFLRTNFTGKDFFTRRKDFDNIKQNSNENVNIYWRRTWRAYYISKEQECPKSYDKERNTIIKKDIYFKFVNGLENGELKKALLLTNIGYDEMPEQAIKMESILNRSTLDDTTNAVNETTQTCFKCGSPSHRADRCQASPKIRAKYNKQVKRERGRSPMRRVYSNDRYKNSYKNSSRSSSRNYSGSRSQSRKRYSSNSSDPYKNNRNYYNNRRSYSGSRYRSRSRDRQPYRRRSGYRGRSERYRSRSYSSPRRSFSRDRYRENYKSWKSNKNRDNSREKRENSRERDQYKRRSGSYDRTRTQRSPYPRYVKFDDE